MIKLKSDTNQLFPVHVSFNHHFQIQLNRQHKTTHLKGRVNIKARSSVFPTIFWSFEIDGEHSTQQFWAIGGRRYGKLLFDLPSLCSRCISNSGKTLTVFFPQSERKRRKKHAKASEQSWRVMTVISLSCALSHWAPHASGIRGNGTKVS